jgi:NAD(P)-dependent dehydrogenase (short-subunit alcohol dehydrogenase family)
MTTSGKIAVITGAGSGIGRATALALFADGFSVVLAGRRRDMLEATAALAKAKPPQMLVVPADVTDPASIASLFDTVKATHGRIDLLFNNAGTSTRNVPIDDLTLEQWSNVVATNLTGSFLCAQHAFRMMKSQQPRGGRIINNGSISAHVPRMYSAPYTATKHAITGLTKSISLDGRTHNIACGQIDIGNAGDMGGKAPSGSLQPNGDVILEPRMDVRHVGDAVLYMASLPLDANVQFMTIMATNMPFIGRG